MDTRWIDAVVRDAQLATNEDIDRIGQFVSYQPAAADDFADLVQTVLQLEEPTGEFGLRVGSWQIDLTKTLIRGGLTSALVAALLDIDGLVTTSVAAFALVLPSIIEVERVSLSAGEERLLAEVRLTHAAGRGFVTVDALYDELPAELTSSMSRLAFADTIERIRAVGYVEDGVIDEHVRVIPEGERRRVTFH